METQTLMLTLSCGVLAMVLLGLAKKRSSQTSVPTPVVKNYEKDMVYLFAFESSQEVLSHSPFCAKVLAYVRLRNIPHVVRVDVFPGPRGQLPFIELNGSVICDSDHIICYFDRYFDGPQHPRLSPAQVLTEKTPALLAEKLALATAIQRIVEDSLYWKLVYFRWITPEGWQSCKGPFFDSLPFPLRYIIPTMARNKIIAKVYQQGTSRLPLDEMCHHVERDVEALSCLLGDKKYFLSNDQLTTTDLVVFAWLDIVCQLSFSSPLKDIVLSKKRLLDFRQRMRTGPLSDMVLH